MTRRIPALGCLLALTAIPVLAQVASQESPVLAEVKVSPVPITNGQIALTPENTLVQFIGTHVGDRPDPRVGNFQKFKGTVSVDPAAKSVKTIDVEIETSSLTTQLPPLTTHLNSPDFFDTRQFPTASFKSTSIQPGSDASNVIIQGDLTLHGVTKPIEFPATIAFDDNSMSLRGEFRLDRTEFDMGFGPERIEKEVAMTVAIGSPTGPPGGAQTAGGPGGPTGRRNFDPEAIFKERDKDGNGVLSGDEIAERMRSRLSEIDTDNNGEISKAEFEERMRQFGRGGQGGVGRGGRDRGPRSQGRPQRPTEQPKEN